MITAGLRLFLLLVMLGCGRLSAQSSDRLDFQPGWIVGYLGFIDKDPTTPYNPYVWLHPQAIERRLRQGVSLYHESDLPLTPSYVAQVQANCQSVRNQLRWVNGVVVWATAEQWAKLRALPFVQQALVIPQAEPLMAEAEVEAAEPADVLSTRDSLLGVYQLLRMKGQSFADRNLNGRGVRVAILDAGFTGVDIRPQFEHIRNDNRIVARRDFVDGDSNVFHGSSHGTMVMSNIGGRHNNLPLGLAPEASFILCRTERQSSERFQEELAWMAAMEWADQQGADVLNSSLGYTHHRYFQEDLNGVKALVARAANMAAAKGILVLTAAGNEGTNRWRQLCTPGDADSVLTIGGIDPYTDAHINFSSYGPTADGRLKPNLAAYGTALVASPNGMTVANGTSFATPLVCGFAACVRQAYPTDDWFAFFQRMQNCGSLYPYFDYVHGYGVPQADLVLNQRLPVSEPTFEMEVGDSGKVWVQLMSNPDTSQIHYLYYHLVGADGKLMFYSVLNPEVTYLELPHAPLDPNGRRAALVRIHYKGYTRELEF